MLEEIETYAKKNNIPIMQKEGIEFLTNFILENDVKKILEIGTAIGYSAIKMALADENIMITTIERDEIRYQEALNNISKFHLENRIHVIFEDALDTIVNDTYDLIFIDAAKSQNIRFFEKFEKNLGANGYIVTDNLNFHGLVNSNEKMSKNLTQLIKKIRNYIVFLKENKNYNTIFYNFGDGISISTKK